MNKNLVSMGSTELLNITETACVTLTMEFIAGGVVTVIVPVILSLALKKYDQDKT